LVDQLLGNAVEDLHAGPELGALSTDRVEKGEGISG
jgi:hypothetical protein